MSTAAALPPAGAHSAARVDGVAKVTGRALYGADIVLPGMLWCAYTRSPMPHARIVSVDVSRARTMPGVRAVLTAADLPDMLWGRWLYDMPILARDRVRFVGEPVAAVAADGPDLAEAAALAVDVVYEELPSVFEPREAMAENAVRIHDNVSSYRGYPKGPTYDTPNLATKAVWMKGDVKVGFEQAEVVFEEEFATPGVHQGYIEPHACLARFVGERLDVWAPNKMPARQQEQLAELLDMPAEQVNFQATSIGGDFGGKGSLLNMVPVCCLAKLTGHPVKHVSSYTEEMTAGNPRHSSTIRIKTGLRKDGTIVARHSIVVWDSGAYAAFKPTPIVNVHGADALGGSYAIPNILIESYCVYTNSVPRGHVRAPGHPAALFAVESHMDSIAHQMGLDPLEFRLRHCLRSGDVLPSPPAWPNHPLHDVQQEATIRACVASAGWSDPKPTWTGRGIAVGDRHIGFGNAAVRLTASPEGTILLETALADTGTGLQTLMRQLVAEELQVPVDSIDVVTTASRDLPPDMGVGASRATHVGGQAAVGAAAALRDELTTRGLTLGALSEPVTAQFEYKGPVAPVSCFSCQIAEVSIDPETGQVTLQRLTTAHDVTTVIHPLLHQGQIDGGVVQGVGMALSEDMQIADGRVGASHLGDYKLPTMRDIPELKTVLVPANEGPGPRNAKAIGEVSVTPVAAAVANAVFDACGVRLTSLPISAEKVLAGIRSLATS